MACDSSAVEGPILNKIFHMLSAARMGGIQEKRKAHAPSRYGSSERGNNEWGYSYFRAASSRLQLSSASIR
jgi:hypothetical protein